MSIDKITTFSTMPGHHEGQGGLKRWGGRAFSLAMAGALAMVSASAVEARLGRGGGGYRFGGGVGVGRPGYHPIYGAGVRPAAPRAGDDLGRGFYNRPYGAVHPAWDNGGYWKARPWATGWYRVNPAGWRWWGASAAAWGITSLAAAATVTELVNTAAAAQSSVILIPQTSFQLNYASVEAIGEHGVSFFYSVDGGSQLAGGANCDMGLGRWTAAGQCLRGAVAQCRLPGRLWLSPGGLDLILHRTSVGVITTPHTNCLTAA